MAEPSYLGVPNRVHLEEVRKVLRRGSLPIEVFGGKMKKVITDNSSERITVKWDGERFAIIQQKKDDKRTLAPCAVIVFNPKEMMDIIQFAANLGG